MTVTRSAQRRLTHPHGIAPMPDNPRVTDDDKGEITVTMEGRVLRSWGYNFISGHRGRSETMSLAREYVEGWCAARAHYGPGAL